MELSRRVGERKLDGEQPAVPELTHLDRHGRARMVDVTDKPDTRRTAVAAGFIRLLPGTLELIRRSEIAKGDVLTVARVAGILAAKQTPQLVPMCHSLLLTDVQIRLELRSTGIEIQASVTTVGKTGAEMEALTAVSVAGLTVYDMCKAVDREMVLQDIRLLEKHGGSSDRKGSRRAE